MEDKFENAEFEYLSVEEFKSSFDVKIPDLLKSSLPVRVKANEGNMVFISEREYESIVETLYLISNLNNHLKLVESYNQISQSEKETNFDGLKGLFN